MFSWFGGSVQDDSTGESAEKSGTKEGEKGWFDSIQDYASRITDTVKSSVAESSVFVEFDKKQKQFARQQQREKDAAVPPWVGYNEEEQMKVQILQLSSDQRNVLRPPPSGVPYQFNFKQSYPVAMAILQEDPKLQHLRFELVPKKITEEHFWRNYFYRVSLIKQSLQVSSSQLVTEQETANEEHEDKRLLILSGEDHQPADGDTSGDQDSMIAGQFASDDIPSIPSGDGRQHHVSINEELGHLGVFNSPAPLSPDQDSATSDSNKDVSKSSIPQWEEELAKELEDLEVLGEDPTVGEVRLDSDNQWEDEITQMLEGAMDSDTNPD